MAFISGEEHAYAAGIIDGEGSIYIRSSRHGKAKREYLSAWLTVTSSDPRLIAWFHERWGGTVTADYHKRAGQLVVQTVVWTGNGAAQVLRDVLPWLLLKREQAGLALNFVATYQQGKRLTADVVDFRNESRESMRALNRREHERRAV